MIKILFEKENNRSIALDENKTVGFCEFTDLGNCWNIIHTEVKKEYQGQHIAKKLVEEIVVNAKKNNKKIIADCSYAKKIIDKLEKFPGNLYIVATPIGNLEDITLRALNVLKEVDIIAAEDTRQTLKLLNYFNISKPLISYHRHNEENKSDFLIEKIKNGENIALVSDAGTPGICDPGEELIKKAIKENINIIPIPGACALINALIVSGLDTKEFEFLGFLPLNKKLRKQKLDEINNATKTIVIYEAPHKMKNTLEDLKDILKNDRQVVLARELTKIHEEIIRGYAGELLDKIDNLKGEMILIIQGCKINAEKENELNSLTIEEHYKYYENKGFDKKEIIKKIAKDRNVNKNDIYMKFI